MRSGFLFDKYILLCLHIIGNASSYPSSEDLTLLTPLYVVLGFIGVGLLVQILKRVFTKKLTPEEQFQSTSFKEYLQILKEEKIGTVKFDTAFCNAYACYRTPKEFQELFAVVEKENYLAVTLQQRWAEHGVGNKRRPLPSTIFSS